MKSAVEAVVGCKWSVRVLGEIRAGVNRPGELTRRIEGLSTKVLNERLNKLMSFGLVERFVFPESPPRVEYRLTALGERFGTVLDEIDRLQEDLEAGRFEADAG